MLICRHFVRVSDGTRTRGRLDHNRMDGVPLKRRGPDSLGFLSLGAARFCSVCSPFCSPNTCSTPSEAEPSAPRTSRVVAVNEGFGGVPHHGEVIPGKSVDRPIEPEQPVSGHQPTTRGLGRVRLAEYLDDRAQIVNALLQARPLRTLSSSESRRRIVRTPAPCGTRQLIIGEIEVPLEGDQYAGCSAHNCCHCRSLPNGRHFVKLFGRYNDHCSSGLNGYLFDHSADARGYRAIFGADSIGSSPPMNAYSVLRSLAYRQTPEHRAALELPRHARRPGRYLRSRRSVAPVRVQHARGGDV